MGYKLKDGDKVVIIEDVITAGTAISECVPQLKAQADVDIMGLVISVDRMERGKGATSAVQEVKALYGIDTYPIATSHEIIDAVHNVEIDGKVVMDDEMRARMEAYLKEYGV